MAQVFNGISGGKNEVVSIDYDIVNTELSVVNFSISSKKETYAPETFIYDYINSLFAHFDKSKEYFENLKNIAVRYQQKLDIVVDPDPPIQASAFDEYVGYTVTVDTNSNHLNVRSEADANSEIVTQLDKGSEIHVSEFDPNSKWTAVEIDGQKGYVATSYLSLKNNDSASNSKTVDA